MTGAEYIVSVLRSFSVSDTFGVPGSGILPLIYAMKEGGINPHLLYHEQGASFAAVGYAQSSGNLGVVYATKGPGFMNALTAVTDAYFDSIPLLLITNHDYREKKGMRFFSKQEIDTIHICEEMVKQAKCVDEEEELQEIPDVLFDALKGRKGPVLIDVNSYLFEKELNIKYDRKELVINSDRNSTPEGDIIESISTNLAMSSRPVFLIGNGLRFSNVIDDIDYLSKELNIPILSSKISADIMADRDNYFGFIGSHGCRYSNFILDKSDFVLSLGNRLAYSPNSTSFLPSISNKTIVRVEVDENEFQREISNAINVNADLNDVVKALKITWKDNKKSAGWIESCRKLKHELFDFDFDGIISRIADILTRIPHSAAIVGDVGNNDIWLSQAYICSGISNSLYYSMSFAVLGVSLCKAIGVYYTNKSPVVCFIGDQGFQFNIQELEYISLNKIPILIVIINNRVSGLIRDKEIKKYGQELHVSEKSGYGVPSIELIAKSYGITLLTETDAIKGSKINIDEPKIIELEVDQEEAVRPSLPNGVKCTNMYPPIDGGLYKKLESI